MANENKVAAEPLQEIFLVQIEQIAKNLKKLDKGWADKLAKKMNTEEPSVDMVYRIVNGTNKHQSWRRLFVTHALVLYEELAGEQNDAVQAIEKMKHLPK